MDGPALERGVEARVGPALADLGRPTVLHALCDGEPTPGAVLRATWASERAAATTFGEWAETATTPHARSTYRAVAAQERAHARIVASTLDGRPGPVPPEPGPLHRFLRGLEAPPARVGAGLVGRPIASLRTYGRVVRYAESIGDGALSACVRELEGDTRETVGTGAALLGTQGDAAPAAAIDAAAYAVQLVRDDYADALVRLGRSFG